MLLLSNWFFFLVNDLMKTVFFPLGNGLKAQNSGCSSPMASINPVNGVHRFIRPILGFIS